MTDTDLYERGVRTAAACWEALAHSTSSADVHRLPHVSVAVFADEPEQSIYNNAILGHGLAPAERSAALEAMEALYAAADISSFAAWVHETDRGMRDELTRRGYAVDTTTRAMGMSLDDVSLPRPEIELAPAAWREHLRLIGVSSALLRDLDPAALHLLVAQRGGESVATAFGFDHEGDCGIYNVGTLAHSRRRGFGTALTATLLHDGTRARLSNGQPSVDARGGADVRSAGLPRPRPNHRVHADTPRSQVSEPTERLTLLDEEGLRVRWLCPCVMVRARGCLSSRGSGMRCPPKLPHWQRCSVVRPMCGRSTVRLSPPIRTRSSRRLRRLQKDECEWPSTLRNDVWASRWSFGWSTAGASSMTCSWSRIRWAWELVDCSSTTSPRVRPTQGQTMSM